MLALLLPNLQAEQMEIVILVDGEAGQANVYEKLANVISEVSDVSYKVVTNSSDIFNPVAVK